jgi:hypothetical protein
MVRMRFDSNRLGRLGVGEMNKTEADYDLRLQNLKLAGVILWHKFNAIKLRLADGMFYTPDFAVMNARGELEFHEVKGFWRDDAKDRIKVAADQYPARFVAVFKQAKKAGGGWTYQEFSGATNGEG